MKQEISATVEFAVLSPEEWNAKVSAWHEKGAIRAARHRREQQANFVPLIMAPKEMESDNREHQFAAAIVPLDKNTAIREAVADHAREIMTLAELQGLEHREDERLLAFTLAAVVEGNLSLEMAIGLFMDRYARFESKFGLRSGKQVREKIGALLGEDAKKWTVLYTERGKRKPTLLPVAVRNWVAHRNGPNSYTRV